ncbi:MAG: hypothetical protein ACXW32_00165 [Limisphaerales bacterium]
MTTRFTIDGSDALETELSEICVKARDAILEIMPARKVRALLLGGGYGRGEGGVLKTPAGDKPYNDLEFYILHTGSDLFAEKLYASKIHHVAEELTGVAGIEVEFKLLAQQKLQSSPVTMFYYDLIAGHRLVHGTDAWLAGCDQHRAAHRIPLYEATRLLMNRCSGLLYSQEKLNRSNFTEEDSDFVGRNLAKAKLAVGDVYLAMRGQYHSSCRERHKRLRKFEMEDSQTLSAIVPLHAQGVDFKLHPIRTARPAAELRAELESIKEIARQLWLTLESRRLNHVFADVNSYTFHEGDKCPETDSRRNRLINARRFGTREMLNARYPRERLLNTLPLLLWESGKLDEGEPLTFVQQQLRTPETEFGQLVRAYESLWKVYN